MYNSAIQSIKFDCFLFHIVKMLSLVPAKKLFLNAFAPCLKMFV